MGTHNTQRSDWIAGTPLFSGLGPKHIEELAGIAVEREYARGQTIFMEGDDGAGFCVTVEGRVKVFKLGVDGKEQILHVFGPEEPFGEVPVFEGGLYPASAAALERCRVLFFPREAFTGLIEKDPSLALNMLAILSRRLRQFAALVEDLSLKEVPSRLAAHLLELAERTGLHDRVELEVPKGQLANLLGTIPETLSRILSRMTSQGLIRSTGPRAITLVDRAGLEELASGERRLS
jgi:CRP/FNR family transcriptional regulator, dissimilatory nitrate respiration regulator